MAWFGLTWNLEEYEQLNRRVYRQGQTKTVVIHHIIARDTVDGDHPRRAASEVERAGRNSQRTERKKMNDAKSVKLPRKMPGGRSTNKHPLCWLIDNKLGERSKRQLAIAVGVRAQTLYGWERGAEAAPAALPAAGPRARAIADYFKVSPALLRPDLWGA